MRNALLALACLVTAGNGRRLHSLSEQGLGHPTEQSERLKNKFDIQSDWPDGGTDQVAPLQLLATALVTLNPAAACYSFNPVVRLIRAERVPSDRRHLFGCHAHSHRLAQALVMSATASQELQIPPSVKTVEAWASELGERAHGLETGRAFYEFFASIATSPEFIKDVWAHKPKLFQGIDGVANSFTYEDLRHAVDSDFLDINVGDAERGGWYMETCREPEGNSFEDAKIRYLDVEKSLKKGTVFLNSASSHVPLLGTVSIAANDAFSLPNCLNLYMTAKGMKKSAPPHTDKQDVFVAQSGGAKRWRVFNPPPPNLKPFGDPLARGKFLDTLKLSELSEPLIDTVLKPGDVLYVPAGFPHVTDTVNTNDAGDAADADSIHLTIGLDTHIWGLDYASIRTGALARAKLPDGLNINTLPEEVYWRLMNVPLNLGFLKNHPERDDKTISSELIKSVKLAEPSRWADTADSELAETLKIAEVEKQIEDHAKEVLKVQRQMYLDAAYDILPPSPPGAPRITTFRAVEHMNKLKAVMDSHKQWYGLTNAPSLGPPPAPGGNDAKRPNEGYFLPKSDAEEKPKRKPKRRKRR